MGISSDKELEPLRKEISKLLRAASKAGRTKIVAYLLGLNMKVC